MFPGTLPFVRKNAILSLLICLLLATLSLSMFNWWSAERGDAYHRWVRQQLADRFAITGGEWLFFHDESELMAHLTIDVTNQQMIAADNMPFTQAVEIEIAEMPQFLWSEGMWVNTQRPVQAGDTVLLTFWTRSKAAQVGTGMVSVAFEEKETWQKSLHWSAEPGAEWQQHFLPFTVEEDNEAAFAHLSFQFGAQLQTLQIGGIAAINYGDTYTVTALPIDDISTYDGRDLTADWRTDAAARIAEHRMGDLAIAVVDPDGVAVAGAAVAVQMQRHAFEWGTAVKVREINGDWENAAVYRQKLLDVTGRGRTFNMAVPENALKWTNWELNSGWWNRDETADAINWLVDHDMTVHGHNVIWGNWAHLPDDMRQNQTDVAYNSGRVDGRITEMLTDPRLAPIASWDILNEGRDTDVLPAIFSLDPRYPTGKEQYADWFALANATAPDKKHYINDFSILSVGGLMVSSQVGYQQIIEQLVAADVRVDGVGMQAHMFYPLAGPERVYAILDQFAVYGIPLRITEFDMAVWDEQLAADYMRDFLTIVYSHPAVDSFVMWDFYDDTHWLNNAPLFRSDWTLKPAGDAYIDLVFDQWWTDEVGSTDDQGYYLTRAFAGQYLVTVTTADGREKTEQITLDPTGESIQIVLNDR